MATIDLKYLVEDLDRHGNVRVYVRLPGRPKVRIREPKGSDAFLDAYRAAVAGEAPAPKETKRQRKRPSPHTLAWLCTQYYESGEFKGLSDRTRYVRKNRLDFICEKDGHRLFRDLEERHVQERRDKRAATPEGANNDVKALRRLFDWAKSKGHVKHNPAAGVKYIRTGSDGHHTWTIDEVEQFEARHPAGSKARLALRLLLCTGVRRSDVVLLGRQMIRDGWLRFTETKGRTRKVKSRDLPILPQLQEELARADKGNLTFLVTEFGKPFTGNGFGNWFRKRCDEAELFHCSAHGLRKAGATIAADNGATEHQLMAIYGWESPAQAALYTRKANRKRLAGDAMHLLMPGTNQVANVPLSQVPSKGGTASGKRSK